MRHKKFDKFEVLLRYFNLFKSCYICVYYMLFLLGLRAGGMRPVNKFSTPGKWMFKWPCVLFFSCWRTFCIRKGEFPFRWIYLSFVIFFSQLFGTRRKHGMLECEGLFYCLTECIAGSAECTIQVLRGRRSFIKVRCFVLYFCRL